MKILEYGLPVLSVRKKDWKVFYSFFTCAVVILLISNSLNCGTLFSDEVSDKKSEDFLFQDNQNVNNPMNNIPVTSRPDFSFFWTFIYLGVILMVLFIFKKTVGKINLSPTSRFGEVIDVLAVGPGKTLVVVKMLERIYILGVTDQNISIVAEIYDTDTLHSISKHIKKDSQSPNQFSELLFKNLPSWGSKREEESINKIHEKNETSVREAMRKIEKAVEE